MANRKGEIFILQHIAELRKYKNGTTLELNYTQQGNFPAGYDIRRWHLDETGKKQPGVGISLSETEFAELQAVISEM